MPVTHCRPSPVVSCAIILSLGKTHLVFLTPECCSLQRWYNLKRMLCEGPEEFFDCSLSQLQAVPRAGASCAGKKGSCSLVSLAGGLAHIGN